MKIFISYRNIPFDIAVATELVTRLRDWGHEAWLDRHSIRPGHNYLQEIDDGLEAADVIIGLMSPQSVKRGNVLFEWEYGLNKPPGRLLLIRIKPCSLEWHPDLKVIHYIDGVNQMEEAFRRLRDRLAEIDDEIKRNPTPAISSRESAGMRRPNDEVQIMSKVKHQWIHSVLHHAVSEADNIPRPRLMLVDFERGTTTLSEHQTIVDAYRYAGDLLLIVGDPGTGKTISLLQLTEALLEEARRTPKARVPVVLHLSSWVLAYNPEKPISFVQWVADELKVSYQVSRTASQRLIEDDRMILMLDGLDEVKSELQEPLIESINAFKEAEPTAKIAICSRRQEYEALSKRLNNAVTIEVMPLTIDQICSYLNQRPNLAGLLKAVTQDETLMQLASRPIFLSVLSKTYCDDGEPIGPLLNKSQKHRETILLETYVKSRFKQPGRYNFLPTRSVLGYLAHWMKQSSLSILLLEQMQVHMLSRDQKLAYFIITRVMMVILFGLPYGILGGLLLPYGSLAWTVAAPILNLVVGGIFVLTNERFLSQRTRALLIGIGIVPAGLVIVYQFWGFSLLSIGVVGGAALLIGGLAWLALRSNIGSMNEDQRDIYPVETLHLSFTKMLKGIGALVVAAALFIGILRLLLGHNTLFMIVPVCLIANSISGGFVGEPDKVGGIRRPGGGIVRSFLIGVLVLIILWLTSFLIGAWFGTQVLGFTGDQTLPVAFFGGLAAALPIALYYGLVDAFKYWILRLLHIVGKRTPFFLVPFLRFTVERELMRQTGRGFIFIHRYLQEYFADRYRSSVV